MTTVHIIGAGIAGLAAASSLARDGHFVQVYEASSVAGGRCKLLYDEDDNEGYDGCNALLFSGSKHVRGFAEKLGSAHTLTELDAGGEAYDVKRREKEKRAAFLLPPPAPLLDMAQLLSLADAPEDKMVGDVFDYYHPLTERYIEPLTRSLTFAKPEQSKAKLFARRLGYLLRKGPFGISLMTAKHSLYQSLVAPALSQIENEGGAVYYGQQLRGIEFSNGKVSGLTFAKQKKALREDDIVLFAMPAPMVASLLPRTFKDTPIEMRDVMSVVYHTGDGSASRLTPLLHGHIDWVKEQQGRIIATSYAPDQLMLQENGSLARRLWREVAAVLGHSPTDMPLARVVKERKAVAGFAKTYGALPENIFCAGEAFGKTHLPPLEAAIASGEDAAHKIRMMIAR